MHIPEGTIFRVLLLGKGEDWGIQTFRNESQDHDLARGTERESIRFNQAEKIMFEYWSCFLVLINL